MPARVLVGIPNYNDHEYLDMVLQSIMYYTDLDEPYDLVVCDDGSQPANLQLARDICAKYGVPLLEHEQNEGIPATWNHLGYAFGAKSEIIVWLNNDMLMVPHWLRSLVFFLDANKDVPSLGTVSLQPRHVPRDAPKTYFRAMLPSLGHTVWKFEGLLDGKEQHHEAILAHDPHLRGKTMESRDGEGQGIGKVMCPCGCSFACRREAFNLVGGFDENILSFHEESLFGSMLAKNGRASFCLNYPRPYHVISGTFMNSPELQQNQRMISSRRYYREVMGVPAGEPDSGFDWVNAQLMPKIPAYEFKYLAPNYDKAPTERTLVGGEVVKMPYLDVKTQVL